MQDSPVSSIACAASYRSAHPQSMQALRQAFGGTRALGMPAFVTVTVVTACGRYDDGGPCPPADRLPNANTMANNIFASAKLAASGLANGHVAVANCNGHSSPYGWGQSRLFGGRGAAAGPLCRQPACSWATHSHLLHATKTSNVTAGSACSSLVPPAAPQTTAPPEHASQLFQCATQKPKAAAKVPDLPTVCRHAAGRPLEAAAAQVTGARLRSLLIPAPWRRASGQADEGKLMFFAAIASML